VSFGIDVNILLYASDRSSDKHDKAIAFLNACAAGTEVFCIAWLTAMSYLRMATHHSIFAAPLSPSEAMGNVESLLRLPHCRALGEDEGFWSTYQLVAKGLSPRGNVVPDAHLAAVLRQHGVVKLYTHDRDSRKFDALEVIDPFASS
jgi:uncharacterized protein